MPVYGRTLARRSSQLGLTKVFDRAKVPDDISILYLDLGTHKEGAELSLVVDRILPKMSKAFEAYGFEASQGSFDQVDRRFSDRNNVGIIHAALCRELPGDRKIRLYSDLKSGIGDSLYRLTNTYEEVSAMRLSDWLNDKEINLETQIVLLRMNIEGAEYDVIQDLVENKLAMHIDGYYGMWDDVSKLDWRRDVYFRDFLSKNHIFPFTFNGRDMRWNIRIRCIEYDINTFVLAGLEKLKRNSCTDSKPTRPGR